MRRCQQCGNWLGKHFVVCRGCGVWQQYSLRKLIRLFSSSPSVQNLFEGPGDLTAGFARFGRMSLFALLFASIGAVTTIAIHAFPNWYELCSTGLILLETVRALTS